jgi:NAD(P)H-dependent FMN reductase
VLYDGLGRLPHFNPDDDHDPLHEEVARMRSALHEAAAVLFSTPEYAGGLPGSFKNLLDWTIGDDQPGSIYDKPVAWINTSPRGARGAHAELQEVLSYAHAAVVEAACAHIPVTADMIAGDGLVADHSARQEIIRATAVLAGSAGCTPGPRQLQ